MIQIFLADGTNGTNQPKVVQEVLADLKRTQSPKYKYKASHILVDKVMRARAEALFASVFTSSPFPEFTLAPACIYLFLRLEQYLPCTRETHPCHQPSHHYSLLVLCIVYCVSCTSF